MTGQLHVAATLACMALTAVVQAASFDCGKASTRDEKLICANATLSSMDDELGRGYRRLWRETTDPAELRDTQIAWLKQRQACADAACIEAAYKQRLAQFANAPAQPRRIAERDIRTRCIAGDWRAALRGTCKVSAVNPLGELHGQTLYAAVYCMGGAQPEHKRCEQNALAVFAAKPGEAQWALQVTYDDLRFNEAALVPQGVALYRHGAQTLLEIPAQISGTGSYNASRYYVWNNQRWELLDTESWVADLQKRLPPGSQFWKGIGYDLKTLTTSVGVYRERDANCCPSGGVAEAQLALSGTRLILKSYRVEKAGKP